MVQYAKFATIDKIKLYFCLKKAGESTASDIYRFIKSSRKTDVVTYKAYLYNLKRLYERGCIELEFKQNQFYCRITQEGINKYELLKIQEDESIKEIIEDLNKKLHELGQIKKESMVSWLYRISGVGKT